MDRLEQLASLVMRIRNLRARIESAGEDTLTWDEEWELAYLRNRLDQMKGEYYAHPRKLRLQK